MIFSQLCARIERLNEPLNMKKYTLSLAVAAASLLFASCGTTQNGSLLGSLAQGMQNNTAASGSQTQTGTSLLSNLLSGVLEGSSTLTQESIQGTWKFTSADCVFESENLLAKAGGAVAATKIEKNLNTQFTKFGINANTCAYTFNSDNTYSAKIGSYTVNGNYTLDTKTKTVKMTYLGGVASNSARVAMTGNNLSLLIESDKLLNLLKGLSALKSNSNITTLSSLLNNYDGLYVGIQMSK